MVEKGMTCVKYLLFAFNLLFFLFGAALIGVGVYVQLELKEYFDFFSAGNVNATAILIIVVGALTLVIGFFGCCGACKESSCMVMTFAVLIGLILICEIGGGIAAFVLRNQVNDLLRDGMKTAMENYGKDGKDGVKATWDELQTNSKCCGVNGTSDWGAKIPESCCTTEAGADCDTNVTTNVYQNGCFNSLEETIKKNIVAVAVVAVVLGVIELLGIIFACCLAKAIRREDQYA